jgi:DNA (cytosine-5)-methyltransferase 1
MITIGSLFDGIGGFPLAGLRNGMTTLWASEIEPFPIRVTKIRFPGMKHLGDVTKINGAEIEPVDIITFGSPCQDLSVAGKRAGLAGERSGLFMEAIRIIREMREYEQSIGRANKHIRPRFAVWENVPGAFSSNKGEDFRAVLEETARVADKTVVIPKPPRGGRWTTSGAIMGDGWSIAWRVLDAQFWGVPQRRRRIFLVADFGGESAPEILFKREGLRRHIEKSREAREGTAVDVERSFRETGPGYWGEGIGCLRAEGDNRPSRPSNVVVAIDSNCQDSRFKLTGQIVPTIPAKTGTGGNNGPMLAVAVRTANTGANGHGIADNVAHTLDGANGQAIAKITCTPEGIAGTVSSKWAKGTGGPAGDEHYNLVVSGVDCRNGKENGDISGTIQKNGNSLNAMHPVRVGYSVRRLTPLECERLQDYLDGWTDIEGASDSGRYKALGNSVAVVCPEYVLEGIKEVIERELAI